MASGLSAHNVSLTKNGYFKLIELIQKYPSGEILEHLDEIAIDRTQARKMLAGAKNTEVIPDVWDKVKLLNKSSQNALLLFSIIYSHHSLIKLFQSSILKEMQGEIKRINAPDSKTYTNLAYSLEQAGLAVSFANASDSTKFDLSPILTTNEIGPLAKTILKGHLQNMGWTEPDDSTPFIRTFEEQIKDYKFNDVFGISNEKFLKWLDGENISKQTQVEIDTNPHLIAQAFRDSIKDANLKFSDLLVTRFISSLITKPFLILSGLSGSGKTKIAQAFAMWISESDEQYCIVPVGADWTSREPLLGYPNALSDNYEMPENGALSLLIKANKHPRLPHFLILDEMNLSHVERYFADFLSVMESKGNISLFEGVENKNSVPPKLTIPNNLYIIGTVNIDETTYMFSPKVLDRANAIEFRIDKYDMSEFLNGIKSVQLSEIKSKGSNLGQEFINSSNNELLDIENIEEIRAVLLNFFEVLQKSGAEFGYRSATEMLRLIRQLGLTDSDLSKNQKIDIAVMQKLLPKLHGSRRKLSPILETLGGFCVKEEINVVKDVFEKVNFDYSNENILYPLSLEKITRMYKGTIDNGFASYAEA